MTEGGLPPFLMEIVRQLRRRRLQVGIGDCHALRCALTAGFGLSSTDELRELCVALWAKSPMEAEIVRAAFARVAVPDWKLQEKATQVVGPTATGPGQVRPSNTGQPVDDQDQDDAEVPQAEPVRNLGSAPPSTGVRDRGLVLIRSIRSPHERWPRPGGVCDGRSGPGPPWNSTWRPPWTSEAGWASPRLQWSSPGGATRRGCCS